MTRFIGLPKIKALILSAVPVMICCLLSFGVHNMCGVIRQFRVESRGLSALIGSVKTTSTAAAYILPLLSASARSRSFMS